MAQRARRIWLVRHAQPLIAHGICYGHLDVPADQEATQHAALSLAKALALTLKQARQNKTVSLSTQSIPIYVSGLLRARQLADELSLALNDVAGLGEVQVQTDLRLNEMNFGIWEGNAWADIPRTAIDQWSADFAQYKFGGGESTQEVMDRVRAAYQTTWEQAQTTDSSDVIWITHAGVIRALNYVRKNGTCLIESAEQWPHEAPGFGQWLCMDLNAMNIKSR